MPNRPSTANGNEARMIAAATTARPTPALGTESSPAEAQAARPPTASTAIAASAAAGSPVRFNTPQATPASRASPTAGESQLHSRRPQSANSPWPDAAAATRITASDA